MAAAAYLFSKKSTKIDPAIARTQLAALQSLRDTLGTPRFCRWFLWILTKKDTQILKKLRTRLIPFTLSTIQFDMHDRAGLRNITLKPRQIGSTTYHILVRLLLPAILEPGSSGLLISQTKGYGAQHFRILQRGVKNFGKNQLISSYMQNISRASILQQDLMRQHLLHTEFSARHEIVFDWLDSKVLVDTAENPDAGTGLTINHLVATEVAYWGRDPESLLSQAKEAVPMDGTIDYESTPNGMGGYFFEEWMRAQNPGAEFTSHFYPWWWQEEYQQEPEADPDTMTVEEEKMQKAYEWTMKQLAWRRSKQTSLRQKFAEKYPEDAVSCFLTSGELFFDKDALRRLKLERENEKPLESFHEGTFLIYKRRIKGRRYVIGADVAEGKLVSTDNSDWSTACVMDIDTGEEMASYRSKLPPEDFAQDLVWMAEMYNNAVISPERNNMGLTVILALRHLLYGNIFMMKEIIKDFTKGLKTEPRFVAGFPTTSRTRPAALNELAKKVRNTPEFWHSKKFIDEALTFVWRFASRASKLGGKRVPQAQEGCHDDEVMARAITCLTRLIILGLWDPLESPSEAYGDLGEPEEEAA